MQFVQPYRRFRARIITDSRSARISRMYPNTTDRCKMIRALNAIPNTRWQTVDITRPVGGCVAKLVAIGIWNKFYRRTNFALLRTLFIENIHTDYPTHIWRREIEKEICVSCVVNYSSRARRAESLRPGRTSVVDIFSGDCQEREIQHYLKLFVRDIILD